MRQSKVNRAADESSVRPAFYQRLLYWLAAQAGDIEKNRPWYRRYGSALAAIAIATTVRHLLDPVLGDRAPYGMYLIAVAFVAWNAGFGPALLTVLGGTLMGRYFFDPPRFSFGPVTESSEVALLMSLTVGMVTALFCESLRITARQNRRLYDLAREADARKDAFLATLAHELRNPLAPIRNAVYLLQDGSGQAPRTTELHQLISRHVDQLVRLVNELLDVSRITQRKIELRRERIALGGIVKGAIEAVRPQLDEKRQRLEVSGPTGEVVLNADGMRLTQVFTNLLHNAVKYTGCEGRIWLTVEVEGNELVFQVRDTGIGIPPEACGRIFDLFEQVDQGIENAQGGLGIGLTLVRELVQLHGGTVEARSAGLGLGSEFVVRLPVVVSMTTDRKDSAGTAAAVREGQRGDSLRVLVVDDSPGVARSLELVLLDWKHDVHVCYDAFAALEAARKFKPDFVLADLGMPKMNGYQLAEELRRLPGMAEAVLVAVSGYGQEADKQRSHEVGFAQHLTKPVDLLELKQVLAMPRGRRL
jgi:signal transduction histidine kinase/CheY-like chemotaxis protein